MAGMDAYTEKAIEMVTAGVVRDALDLRKEDAKTRERYKGVEQFLTARRLVEAGVGCVTLSIGGWDTHGQNFQTLKRQLPQVDRGIANLIQDLHDRGMADDVVTVMWGEFGRTPKINSNAGRDHWSPVMSRDDRRRRAEDGPGGRRHAPRRASARRIAADRAAACSARSTGHRHRPGDDVPQRRRPADVRPRRPRAGQGTAGLTFIRARTSYSLRPHVDIPTSSRSGLVNVNVPSTDARVRSLAVSCRSPCALPFVCIAFAHDRLRQVRTTKSKIVGQVEDRLPAPVLAKAMLKQFRNRGTLVRRTWRTSDANGVCSMPASPLMIQTCSRAMLRDFYG